jgi:FAD/FMN-containing dehydrogenase
MEKGRRDNGNPELMTNRNPIESLNRFREEVRGQVILEGDREYESSRKIWNGMIDKRPLAIIKCSGNADVIKAVNFARTNNIKVSVKGGGHNVAGNSLCDGGIVIDLSPIKHVLVDSEGKTVKVGGGATLGDVDHETQIYGLATPLGVVSKTGIGGLTLHGGMGLLSRKFGLTADNLIGAEVVTAGGQLLKVNKNQHADLFWAIRGGGGSFGVVTSFEFQLHPVGTEIWIAMVMYPFNKATSLIRQWREIMINAPDEIMSLALLWSFPDEEFIPEADRQQPCLVIAASYAGTPEEGEKALMPFRTLDTPTADLSGLMPYLSAQKLFDPEYPDGMRYYWKSTYMNDLDDELIQTIADHASKRPSVLSSLDVWALGGALGRTDKNTTAFAQREAPFMVALESNWTNPSDDEINLAWSRNLYDDLQRFSNRGTYLNFAGFGENTSEMVRNTFGNNFEKLKAVKEKYDPDDFFSSSFNIK